jgi:hypothetical protein
VSTLEEVELSSGQIIMMHKKEDCTPPCAVHGPSEHHMKTWKLIWRDDRGIFERICPHGVGHPDPDTMAYLRKLHANDEVLMDDGVHGCDGCCKPPLETAWSPNTV